MITNNELNISNNSYTKKDFYQIYPEILDLVTKITKRWDPESSNESDPGIVLLKLLAFVADKNNYNIDKNILECFMPSCTQEESMRKLCDMMGYDMHYYVSATTNLSFVWMGSPVGETGSITIPKFTSITTSTDDTINYITLADVKLTKEGATESVPAIEGKLQTLTVGNSDTVKLFNLDDNKRVYLPEPIVSENGIFVTSVDDETISWNLVNNLYTQVAGSRVFKFGYDSSKKLPYLQFSQDIDTLIGNGLTIKYLRTTGESGNVKANLLNTFADVDESWFDIEPSEEELTDDYIKEYLKVSNVSATITGKDPETIDEAYNGFKKVVGTFDTLVTCRDYANAIYNLVDNNVNRNPLVSNCQVSDIRDDLNRSYKIMTFNDFGLCFKTQARYTEESGSQPDIDNFDLFIYPFNAIKGSFSKENYINSFKPNLSNIYAIEAGIEENKTISHEIRTPDALGGVKDVFCIKNYYDLSAKINTTYKVNSAEEKSILNNITEALYKKFNARNVDFGEELVYEEILKTIEAADTRIKNVSLDDPKLHTKYMLADSSEADLIHDQDSTGITHDDTVYLDFIIKNILAGRLRMFKYNDSFKHTFGQSVVPGYEESQWGNPSDIEPAYEPKDNAISGIYTELAIDTSYLSLGSIILNSNENITFITPNYSADYTYTYKVGYNWQPLDSSLIISANGQYKLRKQESSGEEATSDHLYIHYQDSDTGNIIKRDYDADGYVEYVNGTPKPKVYLPYVVISPNFELELSTPLANNSWPLPIDWPGNAITGMRTLGSSEQLSILKKQAQELDPQSVSSFIPVFWITNNGKLEDGHILEDGEYFFYANSSYTALATFSTGTTIELSNDIPGLIHEPGKPSYLKLSADASASLDNIISDGINAIAKTSWFKLNQGVITIIENKLINLSENDSIISLTLSDYSNTIDNELREVIEAKYRFDGGESISLQETVEPWFVRSRLNLNVGPATSQVLFYHPEKKISFILLDNDGENLMGASYPYGISPSSSTGDISIRANYVAQGLGENIDTHITIDNPLYVPGSSDIATKDKYQYIDNFSLYVFSENPVVDQSNNLIELNNFDDQYTSLSKSTSIATLPINIPANNNGLISVYFKGTSGKVAGSAVGFISGTTPSDVIIAAHLFNDSDDWTSGGQVPQMEFGSLTLENNIPVLIESDAHATAHGTNYPQKYVYSGRFNFEGTLYDHWVQYEWQNGETELLPTNYSILTNIITENQPTGISYYNRADGHVFDGNLIEGLNVLKIDSSVTELVITKGEEDIVIFTDLSIIPEANRGLDLNHLGCGDSSEYAAVTSIILDAIKGIAGDTFLYNAPLDNNLLIDYDTLDPLFWFDNNNLFDKFTIAEINPDLSKITLTKASKLK